MKYLIHVLSLVRPLDNALCAFSFVFEKESVPEIMACKNLLITSFFDNRTHDMDLSSVVFVL